MDKIFILYPVNDPVNKILNTVHLLCIKEFIESTLPSYDCL